MPVIEHHDFATAERHERHESAFRVHSSPDCADAAAQPTPITERRDRELARDAASARRCSLRALRDRLLVPASRAEGARATRHLCLAGGTARCVARAGRHAGDDVGSGAAMTAARCTARSDRAAGRLPLAPAGAAGLSAPGRATDAARSRARGPAVDPTARSAARRRRAARGARRDGGRVGEADATRRELAVRIRQRDIDVRGSVGQHE